MQRQQITLDSFHCGDRAEPETSSGEAPSMSGTESVDTGPYDHLMKAVIDDNNIDEALKRVVGNRGAPGVDGMDVTELEPWLKLNREFLKDELESVRYAPTPVRRKEIPKDSGGTRKLGIPTVCDRLVQQMIAQVLEPLYDPTFSESSYGFRPGRSAVDAVMKVREYYDQGYVMAVGIDLEKFFDTIQHDFMMNILRERIKDRTLIHIIKKFLRAGVVLPNGLTEATWEGAPQGGPLSPLLSNIYLDKLDKELEARGLKFCRYADDSLILVRSRRSAERVCESVTRFVEKDLKLRVNREKTEIGSPKTLKFLGFKLSRTSSGTGLTPHPKAIAKFKKTVRGITKRNRGISVGKMLEELKEFMKGWIGYYGATTRSNRFKELDEWVRRRVRQFIFKKWKNKYTRVRNLMALCPPYWQMPNGRPTLEWVQQCWGAVRSDSYWQAVKHSAVHKAMNNSWLKEQGMFFLMDDWEAVKERWTNRRMPSGTYGGVRGQPMA